MRHARIIQNQQKFSLCSEKRKIRPQEVSHQNRDCSRIIQNVQGGPANPAMAGEFAAWTAGGAVKAGGFAGRMTGGPAMAGGFTWRTAGEPLTAMGFTATTITKVRGTGGRAICHERTENSRYLVTTFGCLMQTIFLAATKQLYEWYFLSICLSVCHTFLTMFPSSYHHEIFRNCHHGPG